MRHRCVRGSSLSDRSGETQQRWLDEHCRLGFPGARRGVILAPYRQYDPEGIRCGGPATAAEEVARFESAIVADLLPRFATLDETELNTLADLLRRSTNGRPR
jgi:hypothetical protein